MSHRIPCSLCPRNLPEGRGVPIVRALILFHFCWHCYKTRRAECEAFMDAVSAPPAKIYPKGKTRNGLGAAVTVLCAALSLPALVGCGLKRPQKTDPVTLRHCAVTNEAPGFIGCDCRTPLRVWDAKLQRLVIYCDGKTGGA